MTELVAIVVGFALTTVAGGWWAAHLQQRSWRNQNDVRLVEAERQRAAQVCRELSQLLDKRLYRMRRLYWAVQDLRSGTAESFLDRRLEDYDEVLYEWNDTLNLNLAWIGTYFGDAARDYLDASYERFRAAGQRLEDAVTRAQEGIDVSAELDELNLEFEGRRADSLNQRNYRLVLAMNTQLREGLVGRNAPDKLPVPSLRG
jgi:hypothetical protein